MIWFVVKPNKGLCLLVGTCFHVTVSTWRRRCWSRRAWQPTGSPPVLRWPSSRLCVPCIMTSVPDCRTFYTMTTVTQWVERNTRTYSGWRRRWWQWVTLRNLQTVNVNGYSQLCRNTLYRMKHCEVERKLLSNKLFLKFVCFLYIAIFVQLEIKWNIECKTMEWCVDCSNLIVCTV